MKKQVAVCTTSTDTAAHSAVNADTPFTIRVPNTGKLANQFPECGETFIFSSSPWYSSPKFPIGKNVKKSFRPEEQSAAPSMIQFLQNVTEFYSDHSAPIDETPKAFV